MSVTRRELCAALPAVLIPSIFPVTAAAEDDKGLPSATFPFEKLAPHKAATGAEIRGVLKGKLATGESSRSTKRRSRRAACLIRLTVTSIRKCAHPRKEQ